MSPLRTSRAIAAMTVALFSIGTASAQESEPSNWSPFLDFGLDVHAERVEVELSTNLLLDEVFGLDPTERAIDASENVMSVLLYRVGGGIASPGIDWIPGHPRFRLRGAAHFKSQTDQNVDSVSLLIEYRNPLGNNEVEDQATTRAKIVWDSPAMWSAAGELQWKLPIEWDVRLSTGIAYSGRHVAYQGTLDRTFAEQRIADPQVTQPFAIIPDPNLFGTTSKTIHHFLGPLISVEMPIPTGRARGIVVSAFVEGQYMLRLNGSSESIALSQLVEDNFDRSFVAVGDFRFSPSPFVARISVGFRISIFE